MTAGSSAPAGPAILAAGFRPFFLLAGLSAIVNLAVSLLAIQGLLVLATDGSAFRADPFRPGENLPLGAGELDQAIIRDDTCHLGDVVQLGVEPPELAIHEREGEVRHCTPGASWCSQRDSNPCFGLERATS